MNTLSRTVTGILSTLLGVGGIILSLRAPTLLDLSIGVVMGIFFVSIGIYIFFNRTEDSIEEVDNP